MGEAKRRKGKVTDPAVVVPRGLLHIPCERVVLTDAMDGIVANCLWAAAHGWAISEFHYRRTDNNRNTAGHLLLANPELEWLAMLDSDHRHPGDMLARLVATALVKPEAKIIAGLAFKRTPPHEPMAYLLAEPRGLKVASNYNEEGLMVVDAAATAAMLIHRSVLEALEPPWFRYTYESYNQGNSGTEDITFCRRVKAELGLPVYVQTMAVTPHLALMDVADDTLYRAWLAAAPRDADGQAVFRGVSNGGC